MVKKRTLPFVYDDSLPTRFGILPRYAQNEDAMRWFEVPAVMMFHVANAWQEGNEVKLFSCCFDQVRLLCPLLTCVHPTVLAHPPPPSSLTIVLSPIQSPMRRAQCVSLWCRHLPICQSAALCHRLCKATTTCSLHACMPVRKAVAYPAPECADCQLLCGCSSAWM